MTKPLYLVSGLALGVTLAASCAAHADSLEPPLLQSAAQPLADAPPAAAVPALPGAGGTAAPPGAEKEAAAPKPPEVMSSSPQEADEDMADDDAKATQTGKADASNDDAKATQTSEANASSDDAKATQPDDADASNDDDDNETTAQKKPALEASKQDTDADSDGPHTAPPPGLAEESEVPPIDGKPIPLTLRASPAGEADDAATALPADPAAATTAAQAAAPTAPAEPRAIAASSTADDDTALDEPALTSPLAKELIAGFYSRINALGYGILQDPINSTLNPNNALAIPRYQTAFDFRPDFSLNFRQIELGIKPRFEASWNRVSSGLQGGTDLSTATAYINEWIARYRVTNQLLVSYGRENLQWGPSQLLSPSNPFNQNNGKNNPAIEQPGQDYARVVVIPNSSLTGSFIANTGEGRLNASGEETGPFHKAYAGKFDYTGDKTFFTLLVSKRETTPWRIGYFGGWNISDALLAYSEGSAALSHDETLPHPDYDILVGATYTLMSGATITGEYFHHNAGCTQENIAECVSPQNLDPTNPYPRRDYVLLQYVDTKLVRNVSLTVRVIQDLNDHSTEFVSDLEYEMGQNWLLYFVPSVTVGGKSTEFGSLVRYSIFAGVSFTF